MNWGPRSSAAAAGCALAVMLAGAPAHAQEAPGRAATIKQVQGEVNVLAGDSRRSAESGGAVRENERIATGAGGAASVVLRDGTVLTLGPQTTMDLSRFRFDGTTQQGEMTLNLLRGTFRMITGLVARLNPNQVRITTPTLTVGIRGTDFIVEQE